MPRPSANAASRIGTAPLRPPQTTKARSPWRSRAGSSSGQTTTGRTTSASSRREQQAVEPDVAAERRDRDRQPERDEDDDLGERRERLVEDLDLGLERRADVADEQAGDEDGEEARAVGDGGDAVDDPGAGERAQRVEARARQREALQRLAEQQPAGDADGEADRHLDARTRARRSRRSPSGCSASSISPIISAIPTGSLAPDSPSRIVPVRPPISRSPSTENITAGSVGRDRGAEQAGGGPVEPEHPVRERAPRRRRSRTCRRRRADVIGTAEARNRRQPIEGRRRRGSRSARPSRP